MNRKDGLTESILDFFKAKGLRIIDWEKSQGVDYNLVRFNPLAEVLAAEELTRSIRQVASMVLDEEQRKKKVLSVGSKM